MFLHTATYLAIRAVNGIIALASLFLLTRLLPPAEYGVYSLGVAAINVISAVLFQWLNVSVARFHAAHACYPDVLLVEVRSLFARVAGVLVLVAIACSATRVWPGLRPALINSAAVGALVMGYFNLNLQIVNARGEPLRYGLLTASRATLTLAAALILVWLGLGSLGAVAGIAIGGTLSVLFFGFRSSHHNVARNADLRRQLVMYGVPLSLTYVFTLTLEAADRFMIGGWHGASAVAGYAAAADLAQQTIGAMLNVFFLAGYPRVINAWEAGGREEARAALAPLGRGMLLVAPLLVGGFVGLAPEISKIVFAGELREQAAKLLPWIAFAVGMSCVRGFFLDIALHLTKATRVHVSITGTMAAVSLSLNLLLIPSLGAKGAAISAAVAFSLGTCLSWWFGRAAGIYSGFPTEAVKAIIALVGMIAAMRTFAPESLGMSPIDILGSAMRLGVGLFLFASLALMTDLSGSRSWVLRKLATAAGPAR